MNPTEALAAYVRNVTFTDFPNEVVLQAKHCILDSIGCALGGAQTQLGQQYIQLAKDAGGKPESTVIGDGARVSCMNAAYTNATLCNALDFCDTYLYAISHPGGPVIQSALPVAETIGASGKDLITAVIVGYEVSLRIGRAIRSIVSEDRHKRVLYNSSFTIFGAASSVGKLLGLNREGIISAFGIAGAMTPGTTRGTHREGVAATLGEAKVHYQVETFLGTFAALQAKKGLEGPKGILDGDVFWTKSGANSCNYVELTEDLANKYRIMEVGFKPVCSCRFTHPSITAVWKALAGEIVEPTDIEEVVLIQARNLPDVYEWDTMVQAQFSVPCAVAMAIAGGEPGPDWYTTGRFRDADIRELAGKVKLVDDPEAAELWLKYGKLDCRAEVKTREGKIRRAHIEHPKGEPEDLFTEDDFERKFMRNAVGTLGQRQAEELEHMLFHLEAVSKISAVTRLLHPPPGNSEIV